MGLSPRLRGNLAALSLAKLKAGSIPAPAGEPGRCPDRCLNHTVYPRACGGTCYDIRCQPANAGLSPRLRGNPPAPAPSLQTLGSIPAPAGEPSTESMAHGIWEVYPRACGGTPYSLQLMELTQGLSPRLRGNRRSVQSAGTGRGSIPAPAGEPRRAALRHLRAQVYPRACGGTVSAVRSALSA